MKLNRWMGILVALMMLLNMVGAVAETEATATPDPSTQETAAEEQPQDGQSTTEDPQADSGETAPVPLYIVLADCGWTLHGEANPGENSVVNATGDADGLTLSLVENVLPKLWEENAQMMVFGYNDKLHPEGGCAPVSVDDAAAISAQVAALRNKNLGGRQSSLLHVALEGVQAKIVEMLAANPGAYEYRLVILSGGAINYLSEKRMNEELAADPAPLTRVQNSVTALQQNGVRVDLFGCDLSDSENLKTGHPAVDSLLLTADMLGEAGHLTADGITNLLAAICDFYVNAKDPDAVNGDAIALKDVDPAAITESHLAVIYRDEFKSFEIYSGDALKSGIEVMKAAASETDFIRLYQMSLSTQDLASANTPPKNPLDSMKAMLDANGDGILDENLVASDAPTAVSLQLDIDPSQLVVSFEPQGVVSSSADSASKILNINVLQGGSATMTVGLADNPNGFAPFTLGLKVNDYRVSCKPETELLYVGEEAVLASCAAGQTLSGSYSFGGQDAAIAGVAEVKFTPAEPGELTISVCVAGDPNQAAVTRVYKAVHKIPQSHEPLTLTTPYFGAQPGQVVQISNAAGEPIVLTGMTVTLEPALADCYYSQDGKALYLAPKAAGQATLTLTDPVSSQSCSMQLTVNSLFSSATFWALAAGAPVCLIGLTTMIVLLIVKLGGKKR